MYTILNNNLQVKGKLTLDNGQGSTAFFGDAITQQIATDNSTDPNNLTTQAFNETDKQGNSKSWGHSLTLSVENTALGSSITTADSILYLDNVSNKYYLMKIIDISGDRNSGFRTINAVNTAVYELGKKLFNTEKTYTKASLADVVNDVYKDVPFSLRIEDDLETVIDYTINAGTSAQAIFQDLQTKYDVDIDSWVELDNSGNLSERVLYFGHLGTDNGELIRYGGAKGFENITAQEVSDTIYTKLWVNGQTDDKNPNNGHIGSVNNGLEYIVDDDANAHEYPIGANQQQPAYLEGIITNNLLSEPQALLDWSQIQMSIFNHARFNYTVTPLHDQVVGIGDIVAVQDFHMQPMILVTSKVIQKVTSFASPETNTFVLGEFSNIFTEQLNKNSNVITLIKKDVTVVQEAADNARVAADEAHKQAVIAQEQAVHAQTSADGKTISFTVASVEDLPIKANEGDIAWVTLEDGTHGYTFINGHWIEDINPNLKKSIQDGVTTAVTQAKAHVDEVKQVLSTDITTAKSQAASLASTAEANAKSAATSQFNQAKDALAEAKTNLQNDIDESKGNIVEINETLTGFDGTLQRVQDAVNGLGQINQLMNTEFTPDLQGWTLDADKGSNAPYASFVSYGSRGIGFNTANADANTFARLSQTILLPNTRRIADVMSLKWRVNTKRMDNYCHIWLVWQDANGVSLGQNTMGNWNDSTLDNYNVLKWENISIPIDAKQVDIRFETREGTNAYIFQPMVSFTDTIGAYVQGNYNNNDALAKVKLTADQASLDLSTYTQDADGRIKKAQSGIEANATAITKKVSQTDYDNKTGELSNKLNTTTDTADGTKQALSDYKEYANGNISGVASDLRKVAGEVDLKLTKTDYDDSQSKLNTSLSQWKADYDGWTGTVSKLSNKVNNLGQVNQLMNTEFNPDLEGWTISGDSGTRLPYRSYWQSNIQATVIGFDTRNAPASTYVRFQQTVQLPSTPGSGHQISMSWYSYAGQVDNYNNLWVRFYDNSNTKVSEVYCNWADLKGNSPSGQNSWNAQNKWEGIDVPDTATYVVISVEAREGTSAYIGHPMLVFGSTVGAYVQGNYNNNAALAQVKITADGISNFVRDSSGNISSDFQTALSRTSIITGSTLATSIQKQTATQISSAITDNNGKIISLINQDSSGVQIHGKNIVLDGKVRITNEFTVGQANIANGAIGNAQIGDASISSAKIANLDASKISGGTISGVDFLVNKSITIASGGVIQSDVVNMGKTSFNVNATNITTERYSPRGYLVRGNGSFLIDSQLGTIGSWGTIGVAMPGKTDNYKNGYFHSEYGINNMLLQAYNYDNGEDDETMNLSSSALDYYTMKKNTKELTRSTNIKSGSVFVSDSVTSNGTVASKHIMLNDTHGIVMLDNVDLYLLGANGKPVGMHGKSWSNSSLRSMKEHFSNVDPKYALDEVLKTDIKSYNFIGDEVTDNYVSPIIDDTEGEFYIPKDFLDSTGRGVKTYSIDGYLIQAIKALQEQITELKQG